MSAAPRILVVDNHDSFVHILVDLLRRDGAEVRIERREHFEGEAGAAALAAALDASDGLLISPGPGTPEEAAGSIAALDAARARGVPVLGVCLGLQVIAIAEGATVAQAPTLRHGIPSPIHHDGDGVFRGLPNPVAATRYHSLAAVEDTIPDRLIVTARSEDGVIMALRHRDAPIEAVQFHPESILTEHGEDMLRNWLGQLAVPAA